MPYYYGGFYFDRTYWLVLIGALISLAASGMLKSAYAKYRQVYCRSGMTGAEAAQRLLHSQGIYDVQVHPVRGELSDHYNIRERSVGLSGDIYSGRSLASVGIAAHECGHAVQHSQGYVPIQIRDAVAPVANIGCSLAMPIFILGLIFSMPVLLKAGILLFSLAALFQILTLPIEFNASKRGMRMLVENGILAEDELPGVRRVLTAAAMTYVAALAATLLQLLRLIILAGGRRNDD